MPSGEGGCRTVGATLRRSAENLRPLHCAEQRRAAALCGTAKSLRYSTCEPSIWRFRSGRRFAPIKCWYQNLAKFWERCAPQKCCTQKLPDILAGSCTNQISTKICAKILERCAANEMSDSATKHRNRQALCTNQTHGND